MRSLQFIPPSQRKILSEYQRLAKREYNALQQLPVVVNNYIVGPLLLQSLLGRARAGHGLFRSTPLPDLMFDEVCDLMNASSFSIRQRRQQEIDLFKHSIDKLLQGDPNCLGTNGHQLYGASFLKSYKIQDPKLALKGAVLIGCHDSYKWRKETESHYKTTLNGRKFNMGYGHEYLIDTEAMWDSKISLSSLEDLEHTPRDIETLKHMGVIVNQNGDPRITNQFIRFKVGYGTCDDASLLSIGKIYGLDALVLGFLVDATDTYEKACIKPLPGGIDEALAMYIQSEWKRKHGENLVSPEEIMQIIYLGAKANSPPLLFSSSHRKFCERERRKNSSDYSSNPTIINHMTFLTNGRVFPCNLGYEHFKSTSFYNIMQERWNQYEKQFGLPKFVK